MQFLYSGGCSGLDVPPSDVLELLAAASFFQLLPLQRYCEARCAQALDLHNVVNMYIHAKVINTCDFVCCWKFPINLTCDSFIGL